MNFEVNIKEIRKEHNISLFVPFLGYVLYSYLGDDFLMSFDDDVFVYCLLPSFAHFFKTFDEAYFVAKSINKTISIEMVFDDPNFHKTIGVYDFIPLT